jgi:hypothetical protein
MAADSRRTSKGTAAEPHPSPVGRQQVPFHAPSVSVEAGIGGSDIMQPVMELRPSTEAAWAPPHDFAGRVGQRVRELQETVKPVGARSFGVELPKYEGTTKKAKQHLAHSGGKVTGTHQAGWYVQERKVDLPSHADYTGHRAKQALGQLGEIMMHQATHAGVDPTEIQFGYAVSGEGEVDVFASANRPEVQTWLHGAMAEPAGTHVGAAAGAEDPGMQRMAAKLLWHREQTEARMSRLGAEPDEATKRDFDVAGQIVSKFFSRDLTVVTNPGGRHAEQNVAAAIRAQHEVRGYQHADVQGSKIRCASCSGEMGHELSGGATPVTGNVLPTQASLPRQEHAASMTPSYASRPARPRAHSLPEIPVVK